MSVITMIKAIKKIHTEDVVLVKIVKFFHTYGKDAYIISYLIKYKLRTIEENIVTVGFSENAMAKVISILENRKINFLIVDRRNDYEVDEKSDNKGLNNYKNTFEKAREYINLKNRLDKIYILLANNLLKKETRKKIFEIEELIKNERRKV